VLVQIRLAAMKLREWASNNVEPIMAVVLFGVWSLGYFFIGHLVKAEDAYLLNTVADQKLPFIPIFVFPYVALFPMFLLPFCLVRDREFFRVTAWSYITLMVFCYLIFWNFPVKMERPSFVEHDFTTWVLAAVYNNDVPANCFPSMHAAMSMMAALTIYSVDKIRGFIALLVTVMIGISALLIKQHYIADILAGFGITAIIYYAYFKQRIHEIITRDLARVPQVIDHYIDESLERRLESIIDRKVEEKVRQILDEREKS